MDHVNYKYNWGKFYWDAWLNDLNLQSCDLAAQGLWINLIAVMHKSDQIGYLVVNGRPMDAGDIAKRVGIRKDRAERLLKKLIDNDVCSITEEGILYCRRIIREEKRRARVLDNDHFKSYHKKDDNHLESKEVFDDYRLESQGEKDVIKYSSLYKNINTRIQKLDIISNVDSSYKDIKMPNKKKYKIIGFSLYKNCIYNKVRFLYLKFFRLYLDEVINEFCCFKLKKETF